MRYVFLSVLMLCFTSCVGFSEKDLFGVWELNIPFKVITGDAPKSHKIIHGLSGNFWGDDTEILKFNFLSDGTATVNRNTFKYSYLDKEKSIKLLDNGIMGSRLILMKIIESSTDTLKITFDVDNVTYELHRK